MYAQSPRAQYEYEYDHWALYICTPERTDYGYAVATIVIINGLVLRIPQYCRRNFGENT